MTDDGSQSSAIKPLERNYFKEGQQRNVRNWQKINNRSHPLSLMKVSAIKDLGKTNRTKTVTPLQSEDSKKDYDPLTSSFSDPLSDPLSNNNNNNTSSMTIPSSTSIHSATKHKSTANTTTPNLASNGTKRESKGIMAEERAKRWAKEREGLPLNFETWRDKRGQILKKYTSNKRIGVTANFLDEQENESTGGEQEELKKKMEQLDMDTKEDKLFLSQTEYIKRMEHNVRRLRKAWQDGKRVLSLKIAIQSAKLLSENSVNTCPQFYPSMFVLVADILDSFGELVFERLSMKAVNGSTKRQLRDNFTLSDVNLEASETCQNWFYKIACIRELSPRLFIELSLFRCWRFIRAPSDLLSILKRLSFMIRGIGDPLVAAYARAYLIHVGFMVLKEKMRPIVLSTFDDFLYTFNQMEKSSFCHILCLEKEKISKSDYIDLFTPCLDWIVQCIAYKSNEEEFFGLVQRYKEGWNNSIILLHILSKFDNIFISKHAKGVSRLIKESFVTTVPRSYLYKELGLSIVCHAPPAKIRLSLLNEIWKVVAKIDDPSEYVVVASVYIEYLLQHFGKKEIDILLGDVIKHLKKDLAFQSLQDDVALIVSHILKYRQSSFKQLFEIMNFLTLIDMLSASHKLSACKQILQLFKDHSDLHKDGISDPVLINSLMDVSRMLHDSIDYLTFADEKRQITELILHFIDYIDYGHDLERQLQEYLECRSIFSSLDGVIYSLCIKVGNLAMRAHQFMHGKHNKKTSAFVKACLAYCHVTIPSLELLWPRLYLFVNLGQIALTNNMIIQAEAFFVAAICLIHKLPLTFSDTSNTVQSTPELLAQFVANFVSTLLLMPGHPTKGPFYLCQELILNLEKWSPWNKEKNATVEKTKAFISIFVIFCTFSQRKFPYCIRGVSSNDNLYGRNGEYLSKCEKMLNRFGKQIHRQLNELKASNKSLDKQASGRLALQFVNVLVDNIKMDGKSVKIVKAVHEIVIECKKKKSVDAKYYQNTMMHIKKKNSLLYEMLKKQGEEFK